MNRTRIYGRVVGLVYVLGIFCLTPAIHSADSPLKAALLQMASPQLDEATGLEISNITLEQKDFTLQLDKGTIYLLKPLQLDTGTAVYGAFFSGDAKIHFVPPIQMERDQIRRFFETDSLSTSCKDVMLFFTGKTRDQLMQGGKPTRELDKKARTKLYDLVTDFSRYLVLREDYSLLFGALRNVVHPRKQAYLFVSTTLDPGGQVFYTFDPYDREEVKFYRYFKQFVVPYFMENICSYSVYADSTYAMVNGSDKAQFKPLQYTINATIGGNGDAIVRTDLSIESELQPVQLVDLRLNERLVVDSIRDSLGRVVDFVRWQDTKNRNATLQIILPEPLIFQAKARLSFYYHGDIVQQRIGEMYVNVRDDWYPVCNQGYNDAAMFDMTFHTPTTYGFVASGKLTDQQQKGDTLITAWRTETPAFDVSFAIGTYTRYHFTLKDLPSLDVYYLDRLHRDSAQKLTQTTAGDTATARAEGRPIEMREIAAGGKNMHEQVADNVIGAIQTFTQRFGELPYAQLSAAEVLDSTRYGFIGRRFGGSGLPGSNFSRSAGGADDFGVENAKYRQRSVPYGTIAPEDTARDRDVRSGAGYKGMLFPGNSYTNLMLLRFGTFERTDDYGEEARYRTSGVAAQWWKHSLSPETYHDEWLAAGLSEYSALIYLQASQGDNNQFLNWLETYRTDLLAGTKFLLAERQAVGALALGPRSATTASRDDYEILMYRKGAFIFHMLRNMLLNLETLDESRFFEMLKDYYSTFKGRRVTTADFRAITEKHTGVDMKWFFDQWVYGTAIPRYKFTYKVKEAEGKGYIAHIRIDEKDVPETFKAYIPIEVEFDSGQRAYVRVLVDKPTLEQDLSFDSRPKKIRLNPFESVLARVDQ